MIELDIRNRSRTKNPTPTPSFVRNRTPDSDSTQKPPTPYDSYSATLLAMTLYFPLLHSHCTRQQGNCNPPEIFQMLGTTTSQHHILCENSTTTCYDHFSPRHHQLVATMCLSQWLIQNKRLFRLLFAQYENHIVTCYQCSLVGIALNH